jgi:hypothetical protein
MSDLRSYTAAHTIFRILETLGWIIVALGALLALIGLASGNLLMFGTKGDPTFFGRVIAMIPGLLLVEAGPIHIALVKVGQANVDTAAMTQEILKITMSGQQVASRSSPPARETPTLSPPRTSKSELRTHQLHAGQQELAETYKGFEIYRRHNGHYINERWFAGLKRAKEHIDSVSSEPILELTPDTSTTTDVD